MARLFVTGSTSVLGQALLADLIARGEDVSALVRAANDMEPLRAHGVRPVFGDLTRAGEWQHDCAEADVVWHLAGPRVSAPLRPRHVRTGIRHAMRVAQHLNDTVSPHQEFIVASSLCAAVPDPTSRDATPPTRPVGTGHWALTQEGVISRESARIVRMGWIYGPQGMFPGLITAVRQRRFRVIGAGGNVMPLVSATDAARALWDARDVTPGIYAAYEPESPTQEELIHHICAETGARRTDKISPRLAAFSLGGPMADALCASIPGDQAGNTVPGWIPVRSWRTQMIEDATGSHPLR